MDQEKEKKTENLNKEDQQKKEWETPDIYLYPIENTLVGGAINNDGALSS
ncbi:MAG: hypothetical protein SVY10_07625 [Thermodesulfobacteriota bacterium]|nr:hypothetical protein [Thermodesulfobacteriota bacterium]